MIFKNFVSVCFKQTCHKVIWSLIFKYIQIDVIYITPPAPGTSISRQFHVNFMSIARQLHVNCTSFHIISHHFTSFHVISRHFTSDVIWRKRSCAVACLKNEYWQEFYEIWRHAPYKYITHKHLHLLCTHQDLCGKTGNTHPYIMQVSLHKIRTWTTSPS